MLIESTFLLCGFVFLLGLLGLMIKFVIKMLNDEDLFN